MHSTKSEILALLKRSDGASVDDLSHALGLASMTVRQHLTALERDGLVLAGEVRRATGRPHFSYRLTDDGHRRVSEGYDRLLALLVAEAGHPDPAAVNGGSSQDRRRALFRRAGAVLGERHRDEIRPLAPQARVERMATVLRSHGGFADWHAAPDGAHELRDFNCVFRATVGSDGACDWHDAFIAAIVGAPVAAAPAAGDGCAACCRYIIPADVPAAAAPAARTGSTV